MQLLDLQSFNNTNINVGGMIAGDIFSFGQAVLKKNDIFNSNNTNKNFVFNIDTKINEFKALTGHHNDGFRCKYYPGVPASFCKTLSTSIKNNVNKGYLVNHGMKIKKNSSFMFTGTSGKSLNFLKQPEYPGKKVLAEIWLCTFVKGTYP